eukprot:1143312-Rhodomonas_salina.2
MHCSEGSGRAGCLGAVKSCVMRAGTDADASGVLDGWAGAGWRGCLGLGAHHQVPVWERLVSFGFRRSDDV